MEQFVREEEETVFLGRIIVVSRVGNEWEKRRKMAEAEAFGFSVIQF